MDAIHITRIRAAIVDVLEGRLGVVRVPAGVFKHGVFGAMPINKQQTAAKSSAARHHFDVQLGEIEQNPASASSNFASNEIATLPVTIEFFTHKRTSIREYERTEMLDYVVADGDTAKQALKTPAALSVTFSGEATLVVSGFMHGPGLVGTPRQSKPIEDWENCLIRWAIIGSLILDVPQYEPG